jgi:5-methylcytosine-specific restriction endonuclease McrA
VTLERRTRLERGQPPARRSELKRSVVRRKRRKSPQKDERADVRAEVYARDRWLCQVARLLPTAGPCFGVLTPHHRRKSGQGGHYSVANLVAACAGHNDALESDADLAAHARAAGLVVRRGDAEWDELGS